MNANQQQLKQNQAAPQLEKVNEVELQEHELDQVVGGLLPAVQKVREAAARMSC